MTTFDHLVDENTPDNSSKVFEVIGTVIALWADIDDKLFDVFKTVLNSRDDVASVIYYRLNSLRDRVELTRKISEVTIPNKAFFKELDETLKEVVKRAEFRNNIAHNPVLRTVRFNPVISNVEHSIVSVTSKNKMAKKVVEAEFEHIQDHMVATIPLYYKLEEYPTFISGLRLFDEGAASGAI